VRRGAEALGSPDEGRLRGLHEPATAGFAAGSRGLQPDAISSDGMGSAAKV